MRVVGSSSFEVLVRRVDVSGQAFLNRTPEVVRFSESRYSIPNAMDVRLGTVAYYRDLEESDRGEIGDSMEVTYRRETDFATFQRESGQTPLQGADLVRSAVTSTRDCGILCTFMAPTSLTRTESIRASVRPNYDAAALIEDPSRFARQLGIDFGNSFQTSAVKALGPPPWMAPPLTVIGILTTTGDVLCTEMTCADSHPLNSTSGIPRLLR